MPASNSRRAVLALACAAATALTLSAASTGTTAERVVPSVGGDPIIAIHGGAVRGVAVTGGYAFRGLPYAAPPTGDRRWRPPQPPASWRGIRDATHNAPSCPQKPSLFEPPGPQSEDCLYLNVSTSTLRRNARRPVLVWIHGGGFTEDGARNYDGTKLAAHGIVVVTINYRLGALGFLAHPALASRGGSAGNYGLMDQQAALRWVKHNIARFGGDPHALTIAGQSAGGVSVLAQLVSRGARGLFQRAIVQSGAFALNQVPLADAETFGETFADEVNCQDQTAECLRHLPVGTLVAKFPDAAIPGVVDGKVLTESIGAALAAGHFARVPILNGVTHNEELIFVAGLHLAVSGGRFVRAPEPTAADYESVIASVLGVSASRASVIAAEYPLSAYPAPVAALSTLLSDANFACPALQVDRWMSRRVPAFAYEFDDDTAPPLFAGPRFPPVATHSSEVQYLFDQPNAPFATALNADQEALAASMRTAWTHFATIGNPSAPAVPWPAFTTSSDVLSFMQPRPQLESNFASVHHCALWGAG
ncbi:MAG TPA: carboxylesterase family protein [Jatrophihabitans sp.]|nr:carboxylesterase family protein [Jatrophihabitans sp.]